MLFNFHFSCSTGKSYSHKSYIRNQTTNDEFCIPYNIYKIPELPIRAPIKDNFWTSPKFVLKNLNGFDHQCLRKRKYKIGEESILWSFSPMSFTIESKD
jgi:hypothetical protein